MGKIDAKLRKIVVAVAVTGAALASHAFAESGSIPDPSLDAGGGLVDAALPDGSSVGERGTLGTVDYVVSPGKAGGIEVCLSARAEIAGGGEAAAGDAAGAGAIEGGSAASVCVSATPPPLPDSGAADPFSVTADVQVPTPEGVVTVNVAAYVDASDRSICAVLTIGGDVAAVASSAESATDVESETGIEPESVEICLPPGAGEQPAIPGLPAVPELPHCEGLPELPSASTLPPELPELDDGPSLPALGGGSGLPELAGGIPDLGESGEGLPSNAGETKGTLLSAVFSLLGGKGALDGGGVGALPELPELGTAPVSEGLPSLADAQGLPQGDAGVLGVTTN